MQVPERQPAIWQNITAQMQKVEEFKSNEEEEVKMPGSS